MSSYFVQVQKHPAYINGSQALKVKLLQAAAVKDANRELFARAPQVPTHHPGLGPPPSNDWMNSSVFKMRRVPRRRIKRVSKSQYAKSKSVSIKKKPAKKISKKRMIKRTLKSQYAKKMTKSKKVKKSIKK